MSLQVLRKTRNKCVARASYSFHLYSSFCNRYIWKLRFPLKFKWPIYHAFSTIHSLLCGAVLGLPDNMISMTNLPSTNNTRYEQIDSLISAKLVQLPDKCILVGYELIGRLLVQTPLGPWLDLSTQARIKVPSDLQVETWKKRSD